MFPIIQNSGSAIQAASRGLAGTERTIAQALSGLDATSRPIEQTQADQGSNPDRNPQETIAQRALGGNSRGSMLDMVVGQTAVSLAATKTQIRANVAVIRTADEMVGSLLDVMA